MNSLHRIFIFCAIFLIFSSAADGQKMSDMELQAFIAKATEKTSEYSDNFKNLSVEETKSFETFDDEGKLKTQKKILSDLIIYEPENNKDNFGEFRNVRAVDGKQIKDADKRAVKIFDKLGDAKSFAEELKNLKEESSRFDKNISVYGLTSTQAFPLSSNLISSFKFQDAGTETIEGRETAVIKFEQTAANPNVIYKIDAPDFLEISNTFNRGTVWLDLKNYKVLKFVSELLVDSAKFTEPFAVLRQEYYYEPGGFGIYLPRKIISENFNTQTNKRVKLLLKTGKVKINTRLQTRLTMEYKNFRKFNVTVKSN